MGKYLVVNVGLSMFLKDISYQLEKEKVTQEKDRLTKRNKVLISRKEWEQRPKAGLSTGTEIFRTLNSHQSRVYDYKYWWICRFCRLSWQWKNEVVVLIAFVYH